MHITLFSIRNALKAANFPFLEEALLRSGVFTTKSITLRLGRAHLNQDVEE